MKLNHIPIILLLLGFVLISKSGYYYAKGILAQNLLEKAWDNSKESQKPVKAWSWADTYPVGKLIIPSLKLSQIILEGTHNESLAFGPAHLHNTSLPGDSGNVVISGHRDSFFRKLENIRYGDFISIEGKLGSHIYYVKEIIVTDEDDTIWLEPTESNCLTLITCYPFDFIGDAPKRFIVRAETVYG